MKNINYETKENVTTLALTVRKEHRLLVINNALQTSKRISIKVIQDNNGRNNYILFVIS